MSELSVLYVGTDSASNAARRRSKTEDDSDMLDYKACIDMLVELMKHPSSWPFLVPVSKKDVSLYSYIYQKKNTVYIPAKSAVFP